MKINKLIIILMSVLLMGLSSCSNAQKGVTEEMIRQLIIEQYKVDDTTIKLTDLTIKSNTINDTHSTVMTTLVIENEEAFSTLNVTFYFLYSDRKWGMISKTMEFVSAVTKSDGDPQQAKIEAKTASFDHFAPIMWGQFHEISTLVLDKVESDRSNGSANYSFVTTTTMLNTTAVSTIWIKARYVYPTGWQYAQDSSTYVETTDFTGDYEIASDAGSLGKAHLDGNMVLSLKDDGSVAYSNTITGTLVKDGETYPLSAEPFTDEWYTDGQVCSYDVKLTFGTSAKDYFVLLVESGGGRGGELNPPYWYGLVGFDDQAWINFLD